MNSFCILNFYKFFEFKQDLEKLQNILYQKLEEHGLKGTILLAKEGINANLGAHPLQIKAFSDWIFASYPEFRTELKMSYGDTSPFSKIKVKIKDQILIFPKEFDPKPQEIGRAKKLSAEEWNRLSKDKDTVVFDARNDYELKYGKFKNAENLNVRHFKDLPEKFVKKYEDSKHKKFLMYCTGGIRCEKLAAFAKKEGFSNCYQLDGGVVKYFQNEEKSSDNWDGSLFVFDYRWAIDRHGRESGEGHYIEDDFKNTDHTPSAHAVEKSQAWQRELKKLDDQG